MSSAHQPGVVVGGRFELLEPLGAGGMASVWKALDRNDDREVALKILHPQLAGNAEVVRRLEREAALLIALRHPNIAACIAPSVGDETVAIAMTLVDGRRLDQAMGERARTDAPWSVFEVRQIFEKLCRAVAHAHAHGVLHRDLKPQNLMLVDDPDVRIVVLDFGVAKIVATAASDATTQGRRLGSLNYAAPEQMRGEPADQRADVFALGVILFELLTLERAWILTKEGRRAAAFSGRSWDSGLNDLIHILDRMSHGERPVPSRARPELPEALDDVVQRATAALPTERFDDVEALLAAFLEATAETVIAAPDAAPTVARRSLHEPLTVATVVQPPRAIERRGEVSKSTARRIWPWVLAGAIAVAAATVVVLRSAPEAVPVERVAPLEVEARPRVVVEAKPTPAAPPDDVEEPTRPTPSRRDRRPMRETTTSPQIPTPPESIEVLRDRILRRSKKIEDTQTRTTIERIATTSAMADDRAGLKLALEMLEKAEGANAP